MIISLNASQQVAAFEKNQHCLYLQRNYMGKPGRHVTKGLFQKDNSRKWRYRFSPPDERMLLVLGIMDTMGRISLDS